MKFTVSDTGIGISDEAKKRLFQSFTQADASTTRKFGGTGLGLAISKSLSEMMHGEIGVDSIEGDGSSFWFTIRLELASEDGISDSSDSDVTEVVFKDMNILVAEDNTINQRVARFLIEKLGHKLDIAENGAIAVEKFKNGNYDLILMDIQMPVMDGLEATKAIRALEQHDSSKKAIPIVALTANTMKGDKEKFLSSGMNDYIGKPFKASELSQLIYRITQKQ